MMYVYEIMKLFKCKKDIAWKVFVTMDIDFSECSTVEFEREARIAMEMVRKENT